MKLLGKFRSIHRESYTSLIDTRKGWHHNGDFPDRVKRELNRSRRSGTSTAYVIIRFVPILVNDLPPGVYEGFLKELIKVLSDNTRDFDLKYLYDRYRMGILLIDTSINGAKLFAKRISAELLTYCDRKNGDEYLKIMKSIEISVHIVGNARCCETFKTSPVVWENHPGNSPKGPGGDKWEDQWDDRLLLDWDSVAASEDSDVWNMQAIDDHKNSRSEGSGYRQWKHLTDIVGSLIGIFLFSPLMLLIVILIKCTSRGPVLFKQKRIGHYGKPFIFLKFRTMRADCDDTIHREYVKKLMSGKEEGINFGTKDEPLYKLSNDSRITKVGHILRKTSLDELPQFFNVLAGDMSLVGPRPALRYEADEYKNWHWQRAMEAKPGITGIWQVSGRSTTTFDEMIRMDLQYVDKQSFLLDLKILFKTIGAVLNTKGAL